MLVNAALVFAFAYYNLLPLYLNNPKRAAHSPSLAEDHDFLHETRGNVVHRLWLFAHPTERLDSKDFKILNLEKKANDIGMRGLEKSKQTVAMLCDDGRTRCRWRGFPRGLKS